MTRKRSAAASRKQAEPVSQAIEDLLSAKDAGSYGRELDRQWKTVEPAAQINDGPLIRGGQLEGARSRGRTLHEQHDGLVLSKPSERFGRASRRQFERG